MTYIPPEETEYDQWDWIKIRPCVTEPTKGVQVMTMIQDEDEARRLIPLIRTGQGWYNPETKLLEQMAPTHYAHEQR